MKYEIGQKVETQFGKGEVFDTSASGDMCHVELQDGSTKWFWGNYLKPYRTPHEKLLDMGFKEVRRDDDNIVLKKYSESELHTFIIIHIKLKSFVVCDLFSVAKLVDLKLSRMLTEYLEWLEEQK